MWGFFLFHFFFVLHPIIEAGEATDTVAESRQEVSSIAAPSAAIQNFVERTSSFDKGG